MQQKIFRMSNINILTSSKNLFQKLLSDYSTFNNDPLNAYKALDCATSAWHLTDWVFHEYEQQNFTDIGKMREAFIKNCDDLKIMHDITTGTKHFTVSRPKLKCQVIISMKESLVMNLV